MPNDTKRNSPIDDVIKILNITPTKLADRLDVSKEYVYMIQNGSRSISKKLANKIQETFGIKSSYLLGESDELTIDKSLINKSYINPQPELSNIYQEDAAIYGRKGVPFYDLDVTASIAGSYLDSGEKPSYYIDIEPLNDCDVYTRVYGESMSPKYESGDIIGLKKITNFDIMRWGHAHVVVTDSFYDNLRSVKNIFPCLEDSRYIIIDSENPQYKGENKILIEHIVGLFLVRGKASIHHM